MPSNRNPPDATNIPDAGHFRLSGGRAMATRSFLFGFEGRINRARYWLASLVILAAMISSLLLLTVTCLSHGIATGPLSVNLVGISASIQFTDDDAPAALFPRIATLAMTLAFGWCYAAVSIKRLHDRNKSGWWIVPYLVVPGLYGQFGDGLGGSWPAVFTGYAMYITLVWGVVEVACLRRTRGPNRFGPDPLAPVDAGARWDQMSEIEFVPQSAGPSPSPHVNRGHE
jgi:uncharacterized membrane protein YhaH (DUF805 family)